MVKAKCPAGPGVVVDGSSAVVPIGVVVVTADAVGVPGSGVVVVESAPDPPHAATRKMMIADRMSLAMARLYAMGARALPEYAATSGLLDQFVNLSSQEFTFSFRNGQRSSPLECDLRFW